MEEYQHKDQYGQNTRVLEPSTVFLTRYCLYARKSTEQDELQALSIDSQIKEMMEAANKEGLNIAEIRRESHSAKDSGQRPVFSKLLSDIRQGMFNGILCWAPDRLSRNAGDLGSVVDLMDQGFIKEIRTHGQKFTNNPNEKFLLMILGSQAKLENDNKGVNVKRGLRAKCEMGWRPGVSPIGYLHDRFAEKGSKRMSTDPQRAPVIRQMFKKVAYEDASGRDLWNWLEKIDFKTRNNKRMTLSMIYRMLKEPFYYGEFEYPVGSGKWYKGNYEPIITREVYNMAQEKLHVPPKRHPGTNEFDFVQILTCGGCGSGICAEEKIKHLKNGKDLRFVYYHCTRGKNRNCKESPIREEELAKQLVVIMDKIDVDELSAQEQIKKEVSRFRKFSSIILKKEEDVKQEIVDVDIRNYAKYILTDGSREEKRGLLKCLKSSLVIKNKTVDLESYRATQ